MFSPLTQQLIEALCCLPGIGQKSAQRMAFHLLGQEQRPKGHHLATSIQLALEKVQRCAVCQTYTEQPTCRVCGDKKRNPHALCVVQTPADRVAIEQTHSFNGQYFVLHGHLSPLDGIGPMELGIPKLLERINDEAISEMIIATNPTMEGKATAHYIANHIDSNKINVSRIAYGVPLGGEIEYLDGHTLAHAFQTRLPFTNKTS